MQKYSMMEVLQMKVLKKLRDLLNSSNVSGLSVENAIKLYGSCMNSTAIENLGKAPLLNVFANFGGWPVVMKNWKEKDFDCLSALAFLELKTGHGYIIPVIVKTDPKNTSRKVLLIDQESLMISKDILRNRDTESAKRTLKNFKKLFIKIAKLLGATGEDSDSDFDGIIDLEVELLQMMSSEENMSNIDYWYNSMTVANLQEKVPQIYWLRYLQLTTNTSLVSLGLNSTIQDNDIVIVKDLPYIKKVAKYLMLNTNSRQIANYLGWRLAMNLILYLPEDFSAALQDYYKDNGYIQETLERWKICANLVDSNFRQTTTLLYIKKYFPPAVRKDVIKLILDIQFQFETKLLENNWMKKNTKDAALKKLRAMKFNVGYPDWTTNESSLDDFYVKINFPIMGHGFFENILKLTEHRTMQVIKSLRILQENQGWPFSALTTNAAYDRNLNSISFPAGFLQLPLFDSYLPDYYNYAAIGSIIGHEITHGFDTEGSKRDASGKVVNWWDEKTKQIFDEKAACFVKQYNNYGLNGNRTLAENIADSGGLLQSYRAFAEWRRKPTPSEKLPGLEDFTIDQLFFLSYGSIWCTKYSPGAINYVTREAKYAPAAYRLIGSISNLKEFSHAFSCINSFYNSTETLCSIW